MNSQKGGGEDYVICVIIFVLHGTSVEDTSMRAGNDFEMENPARRRELEWNK